MKNTIEVKGHKVTVRPGTYVVSVDTMGELKYAAARSIALCHANLVRGMCDVEVICVVTGCKDGSVDVWEA